MGSEAKELQDFLDHLSTFSVKLDSEGKILFLNRVAREMAGGGDFAGTLFFDGPWWKEVPGARERVTEAFKKAWTESEVIYEENVSGPEGHLLIFNFSFIPIRHASPPYLIVEGHDITAQKRAEESLQDLNGQLLETERLSQIGSWKWRVGTDEVTWSRELFRIFGLSPSEVEMTFDFYLKCVHPQDRTEVRKSIEQGILQKGPFRFEHRIIRRDGSVRVLSCRGEVRLDLMGAIYEVVGTAQDISDLKYAEEKERELGGMATRAAEMAQRRASELEEAYKRLEDAQSASLNIMEDLEREKAERELILSSAGDGIYGMDLSGRTTFVNPAAAEMLGWEIPELVGRNHHELLRHSAPDGHYYPKAHCPVCGPLQSNAPRRLQYAQFWRKNATSFPLEYVRTPIVENGQVIGSVVVFKDITERKRAEEELKKAKEAAEVANKAKSEFLANMSHEIRTPMNGILGLTELVMETQLSTQQRDYLQMVKASADSLLRVINDILDFSKIEAGRLELDPVPFRLRETVDEMLKTLVMRAEKKGLKLGYRIADDVPNDLVGDFGRLNQILVNLIGNAIKFTEKGEVGLAVDLQMPPEAGPGRPGFARIHFAVFDTGVGIPPDKQQHIFEAFSQADSSTTRRYGGTGLGLTISSQLVGLMHGRIWVESKVRAGSTFHFFIEFALTEVSATAPVAAPVAAHRPRPPGYVSRHKNLRLLLAEDSLVNQRLALGLLQKQGHQVTLAQNGEEAVAAVQRAAFDVILMDVQMPNMDGFEATRVIRSMGFELPIIALTAHAMKGDREACLRAGMNDYVSKPINPGELFQAIDRVLDSPAQSPEETSGLIPDSRLERSGWTLLKNLGGDIEFARELASLFSAEAPKTLKAIQASIENRDPIGLERAAHKLKGSLLNFGVEEASRKARQLEELSRAEDWSAAGQLYLNLHETVEQLCEELKTL